MKSKLTIALIVAAIAGGLAYWLGYRQGAVTYYTRLSQYHHDLEEDRWRRNGCHQAWICLGALTNLNAGKQAQAGAVLEQHLNEGVCRLASSWETPQGDQFDMPQILLLRAARDYRLQHPWTNEGPERVERLEKAFKMLDAPDQVKRLENWDKLLKLPH
jgi:hypothetical protein